MWISSMAVDIIVTYTMAMDIMPHTPSCGWLSTTTQRLLSIDKQMPWPSRHGFIQMPWPSRHGFGAAWSRSE